MTIDARIKTIEGKLLNTGKAPIMRCEYADGTIADLHILEAINSFRAGDCIVKVECISRRETAPKLVNLFMQILERERKEVLQDNEY